MAETIDTNLMIGDWVETEFGNFKVLSIFGDWHGVEVQNYNNEGNNFSIDDSIDLNCKGVPLTKEILIKNGWNETKPHWFYNENNYIYLAESTAGDGWLWEMIWTNTEGQVCIKPISTIKYVHELQHILRVCEFTTKADRFEV
jgi:hypothetical protein